MDEDLQSSDPKLAEQLISAVIDGDEQAVAALLDRHADINHAAGQVPLVEAASSGHLGVLELLLRRGADVNGHSGHGRTALIAASAWPDSRRMVELLLAHDADVNQFTDGGDNAIIRLLRFGDRNL